MNDDKPIENERSCVILILVVFILFNLIAFFIPKKLSPREIYTTIIFALYFGSLVDAIFSLHYNVYGYFKAGFQWGGILIQLLYFPSISSLFLNLFPYSHTIKLKMMYYLAWEVFSLAFEWCTVHTSIFYYNGWKIWYSALAYPVIFSLLLLNLKVTRVLKGN